MATDAQVQGEGKSSAGSAGSLAAIQAIGDTGDYYANKSQQWSDPAYQAKLLADQRAQQQRSIDLSTKHTALHLAITHAGGQHDADTVVIWADKFWRWMKKEAAEIEEKL